MTEEEWLTATAPTGLLWVAYDLPDDRRFRLFACACARRIWHLLPDVRDHAAVEVAERFADGLVGDQEREAIHQAALKDRPDLSPGQVWAVKTVGCASIHPKERNLMRWTASHAVNTVWWFVQRAAREAGQRPSEAATCKPEEAAQVGLLRCIYGNPFRPVNIDPAWRTTTVTALAQAAYDERLLPSGELDSHRLAILADALEEVGASEDLLTHLRSPGVHVRGCWVIDALLPTARRR